MKSTKNIIFYFVLSRFLLHLYFPLTHFIIQDCKAPELAGLDVILRRISNKHETYIQTKSGGFSLPKSTTQLALPQSPSSYASTSPRIK